MTFAPAILLVGNDDGGEFVRKGFVEKVESSGSMGEIVGDAGFCERLNYRGDRGLTAAGLVLDGDSVRYATRIRSAQMRDPAYMAIQSPPDTDEVYRTLRIALHGLSLSLLVVALPSSTKEEFFAKADRFVSSLGASRRQVHTIFQTSVSEEYWAIAA
jgi:hypothetical protein